MNFVTSLGWDFLSPMKCSCIANIMYIYILLRNAYRELLRAAEEIKRIQSGMFDMELLFTSFSILAFLILVFDHLILFLICFTGFSPSCDWSVS